MHFIWISIKSIQIYTGTGTLHTQRESGIKTSDINNENYSYNFFKCTINKLDTILNRFVDTHIQTAQHSTMP